MHAALLAALVATAPATPSGTSDDETTAQDTRARAKAAYRAGQSHAREGDYAAAIDDFTTALGLRPSPGLHYNIAVCHHRLLLQEDDPESATYEQHRAAAVRAYNAYLDAAPNADDRYAVAATIQDLRGRPRVIDEWRIDTTDHGRAALEIRNDEADPEPEPAAPTPSEDHDDEPPVAPMRPQPPPPARTPMRPGFPHGMFGLGLALDGVSPGAMSSSRGIDSVPALGPVLRGGSYIGNAREVLLGAEFAFASTTTGARRGHRLSTIQLAILVEWARKVGNSKRLELGVSATAGLGGQSMAHAGPSPAMCPVRSSGIVSTRGGVLLGGRFLLRGLFGARNQHALGLRVGPTLAGFGGGTKDTGCVDGEPSPFAEYDIGGASLILRTDVGYAFRW